MDDKEEFKKKVRLKVFSEINEIFKRHSKMKIKDTLLLITDFTFFYKCERNLKQKKPEDVLFDLLDLKDIVSDLENFLKEYEDVEFYKKLYSCYSHLVAYLMPLLESSIINVQEADNYIKRKYEVEEKIKKLDGLIA